MDQVCSRSSGRREAPGNVTVIGVQWGDEGKGKIVDWLASGAGAGRPVAAVVRFNGGHNAGHTLVAGRAQCRVRLVPSGVLAGVPGIIGNGVAVDPFVLLDEIDRLNREGLRVSPATLCVAETAALVLPVHAALDRARDAAQGLGTTGSGIGPALEDKVGRRALRLCDLADDGPARERLQSLLAHASVQLRALGVRPYEVEEIWPPLRQAWARLAPYAGSAGDRLLCLQREGRPVLFEGAQSMLLDIDHGTFPYVTSSTCGPGGVPAGAGVGADAVGALLGVAKAYLTRVGAGPFPTEESGTIGRHLAAVGREVGTNTGRPRRCGWLDGALLRQACRRAGVQTLAITKLDVLDGLPVLKIGTGYRIDGAYVPALPPQPWRQMRAEPVYETLEGWSVPTRGARSRADLPDAAVRYLRRIEALADVPVSIVSTGADRMATLRCEGPGTPAIRPGP